MAKPELGLKRQCVACGTRFYDLMHSPAVCPRCGTEQPAEPPRPRRPGGAAASLDTRARKPPTTAPAAAEDAEVEGVAEGDTDDEDEGEEVLEDTSDLEDGDSDLASDIPVDESGDDEER